MQKRICDHCGLIYGSAIRVCRYCSTYSVRDMTEKEKKENKHKKVMDVGYLEIGFL